MDLSFYNVDSVREFTYILTVVCANTIIIWLFSGAYKLSPFRIIHFILTTLNNEQHPYTRVRVDEYGTIEKSTDVTKLLVYDFSITM